MKQSELIMDSYLTIMGYDDITLLNEEQLFLQEISLNIDKLKSSFEKNKEVLDKTAKKLKLKVEPLKSFAVDSKDKIKEYFADGLTPKEAADKLKGDLSKAVLSTLNLSIKSSELKKIDDEEGPGVAKKVLFSVIILYGLLIIQSPLIRAAYIGGGESGVEIAAVTIGPIFEEFAKYLAIKLKMPFLYTGIFAGFEFLLYVVRLMSMGASLPAAMAARSAAVMLHFSTTALMNYFMNKTESSVARFSVYCLAVMIHSLFNLTAVLAASDIARMIGVNEEKLQETGV